MIRYDPFNGEHVEMLQHWYNQLHVEGNFLLLFGPQCDSWTNFYNYFRHLTAEFYVRESRIAAIVWYTPAFDGVAVACWADARFPLVNRRIIASIDRAVQKFPVVVAYTLQPRVGRMLSRLGFSYSGVIPKASMGDDLYVLCATKENWHGPTIR